MAAHLLAAEAQQREHRRRRAADRAAPRAGPRCPRRPTGDRRSRSPATGASASRRAARAAPRRRGAEAAADRRSRARVGRAAPADRVHLEQHRKHAGQRRHVRAAAGASTSLGRNRARDSGSGRRRPRRAPCRAPTRSRSSGRPAPRLVAPVELAEESPDQRALADARGAVTRRRPAPRPSRPRRRAPFKCLKLVVTADERACRASPSTARRSTAMPRAPAARSAAGPVQAPLGLAIQQAHAQTALRSAGTLAGATSAGAGGSVRALAHAARRTRSPRTAAFPSAPRRASRRRCTNRWPRRARRPTLPRGTCTPACRRRERLAGATRRRFGDQAEVENHDSPFGRDQHVRRLDVAVQLAPPMQCGDAVDELPKRGDEPIAREARPIRLRARSRRSSTPLDQLHREERSARPRRTARRGRPGSDG